MAILAVAAISSVAGDPQPAAAAEYPWCAEYSGGDDAGGGRNCGFASYDQCMMTVRGIGGSCERNQFFQEQATKKPQQPLRKRER